MPAQARHRARARAVAHRLLTVIASGFAFSMRSEALAARNAIVARAGARGRRRRGRAHGVRALAPALPGSWLPNGAPHAWKDGDIAIVAQRHRRVREDRPQRRERGRCCAACSPASAAPIRTLAAQHRRRDRWTGATPDDLRRPNGAEARRLPGGGLEVQARATRRSRPIGEFARVLGMTPAIYARIVGSVTVLLAAGRHQPADRVARRAARAAQRDAGGRRRATSRSATRRSRAEPADPAVPARRGLRPPGAVPTWRIRAEATLPDGVTFVREAVVRPSPRSGAAARRAGLARRRVRAAAPPPTPATDETTMPSDRSFSMGQAAASLGGVRARDRRRRLLALVGARARAAGAAPARATRSRAAACARCSCSTATPRRCGGR